MAGINRLGKGTAKPGTLRPADPNRFKTEDFFSVDAEQDPEYLRRIVEVEQLAVNKTGSVLAKGAFDKNDALFMRDEAEKSRHRELEQRDAELAHFSRLRSKMEQDANLELYDSGPAPKRTKMAKPKAIVRRAAEGHVPSKEQTVDPGGCADSAQPRLNVAEELSSSRDPDGAAAAGGQLGTSTPTAQPKMARAPSAASAANVPGDEVAVLVTSTSVMGGQLGGGGAAALPKFATAPAKSGCLGLQYDSDDESDEDD